MFKYLTRGLMAGIAVKLMDNCRHLSVQLLRIEAAKSCLHGVRMARLSVIGLMWMGFFIGLICVGVLLLHAGLFLLLPWSVEVKAVLGMFLGLVYVAVGCAELYSFMNEKTWMEKSGVAEMLDEVISQSHKE